MNVIIKTIITATALFLLSIGLAEASVSTADIKYFEKQRHNILEASDRTGISPDLITAIAFKESGLGRDKYNRGSGTMGVMQFTRTTWRTSLKANHKELGLPSNVSVYNDRANILIGSADLAMNKAILTKALKRRPTDGELYMTHLIGLGGTLKILQGKPNAPISRYVKLYPGNRALTHSKGRPLTVVKFKERLNYVIGESSRPFLMAINQARLDDMMQRLAKLYPGHYLPES